MSEFVSEVESLLGSVSEGGSYSEGGQFYADVPEAGGVVGEGHSFYGDVPEIKEHTPAFQFDNTPAAQMERAAYNVGAAAEPYVEGVADVGRRSAQAVGDAYDYALAVPGKIKDFLARNLPRPGLPEPVTNLIRYGKYGLGTYVGLKGVKFVAENGYDITHPNAHNKRKESDTYESTSHKGGVVKVRRTHKKPKQK